MKKFNQPIMILGFALSVILCGTLFFGVKAIVVSATQRELPIYCVEHEEKLASLTFDAAWGADDTQTLIDILAKYDVKATFFLVGQWVDKYPDKVKLLYDSGHEIMNHSNTHPKFTLLSKTKIEAELEACSEKIKAITGIKPDLFRPPYGDYDNKVITTSRELGYEVIQWNVDSLDWKNLTAQEIFNRVTAKTVDRKSVV